MIESVANRSVQPAYGLDRSVRPGSLEKTADAASSASENARSTSAKTNTKTLSPAEQQVLAQLQETDRKVRAHEQAHLSAGGGLVRGGATFSYQTGPDQQRYAVGGEVSIDASPGRTPEETIPKAQQIRAAALAPADPSAQDRSVAAQASLMEAYARAELAVAQRDQSTAAESAGSKESERTNRSGAADFYRAIDPAYSTGVAVGGQANSFA